MISANPFKRETEKLLPKYMEACERVFHSGWFILGSEVESFEQNFATYLGSKDLHVIGCASGMDALILSLKSLGIGPGDEVITTPLSAAATALAISHVGARPVFADVCADSLSLDPEQVRSAVTNQTKAIIPVHLYGYPARIEELKKICDENELHLIEDCAQSTGSLVQGRKSGTWGTFGCYSFYPTKNLGAIGDAGALVTSDPKLAEMARKYRNYGQKAKYDHEFKGYNSRLDELQAALLSAKLPYLEEWNMRRKEIAQLYDSKLADLGAWMLPQAPEASDCVYHLYPIQVDSREKLLEFLKSESIEALVHYPKLISDQACYQGEFSEKRFPIAEKAANRLVSLPISPFLTNQEVEKVAACVRRYLER